MDFSKNTREYYARWLGCDPVLLLDGGVHAVASPERERQLPGYADVFPLFALGGSEGWVLSHSPALKKPAAACAARLFAGMDADAAAVVISGCFGRAPIHGLKFTYRGPTPEAPDARPLCAADYPVILAFMRAQYPNSTFDDWLEEYFAKVCAQGMAFAVERDGILVSATDAPTMPYMADRVKEVGINTLPAYRGRGLATQAAAACIRSMVARGICPMWSCAAGNEGSRRLALRLGFEKLGDSLYLTAPLPGDQ